jgi:dihydropteroate synthase
VLVGASRKRFVGELSGVDDAAARVHGSVGAHVFALTRGARLFRVHDVRAHREALDVAWALLEGGGPRAEGRADA